MTSQTAPEVSVIAPCFNEADTIEDVVAEWDQILARTALNAEIVLCNDGSTDATGVILDQLASQYERLVVTGYTKNRGYGAAMLTALAAARGRLICLIDSDGQFDLNDLPRMIEALNEGSHVCVTGYRRQKQDTFARVAADRALNLLVRVMFGTGLRDTNCALKVVVAQELRGLPLVAQGFAFPTELCLRLSARGLSIGEVPVNHRARAGGATSLRVARTGLRMLGFLLQLKRELSQES